MQFIPRQSRRGEKKSFPFFSHQTSSRFDQRSSIIGINKKKKSKHIFPVSRVEKCENYYHKHSQPLRRRLIKSIKVRRSQFISFSSIFHPSSPDRQFCVCALSHLPFALLDVLLRCLDSSSCNHRSLTRLDTQKQQ